MPPAPPDRSPPYPNLLSPLRIGRHTIRNRVWMAAHATLLVKEHLFTDASLPSYDRDATALLMTRVLSFLDAIR